MEKGFRAWCEDYVKTQRRYFSDDRVDFVAELLDDADDSHAAFPWDGTIVQMTRYFIPQYQRQRFQQVWNMYTQEVLDEDYVPPLEETSSSSSSYASYASYASDSLSSSGNDAGPDQSLRGRHSSQSK